MPQFYSSNKKEEVNKMTVCKFVPYTTQEPEKRPIPHQRCNTSYVYMIQPAKHMYEVLTETLQLGPFHII